MPTDTLQETRRTTTAMTPLEIRLSIAACVLLFAALFIHLGQLPLRLEEPRRALIALEMLFNENLIVPTQTGEFYYMKPPLYNWLIIGSYQLFGNYDEITVRFFSLLSYLGMGLMIFLIGKRHIGMRFGVYAGLLYLIAADLLFYFTTTAGEIDLFYSFLTLASFFTLFHYYEKQQYLTLFTLTYLLAALGTLTKGFPSMVFMAISLPVFFFYNKDFKRLFTWQHVAGIAVYLLIVVGYFAAYAQYNGLDSYFAGLWSQSSERTLLENSILSGVVHLFVFPLETLKNIAPASLLLLFVFRKNIWQVISKNKLILFCTIIFLSNIIVYWISPGTRSRYVYMLYALPVMVFTYAYLMSYEVLPGRHRILIIIVRTLLILSVLCCITLPFIPALALLPDIPLLSAVSVVACGALLWFHFKKPTYSLMQIILLAIVLRLVFDFTVIPHRATHTGTYQDKVDAATICEIAAGQPLHIFEDSRISLATVFYIEREREQTLDRKYEADEQAFFLADAELLTGHAYEVLYSFSYHQQDFHLIKFK